MTYNQYTLDYISREARRVFKLSFDLEILWVNEINKDPNYYGIYRHNQLVIEVKKTNNLLKMIETLMHEIIHHLQFRSKKLKRYYKDVGPFKFGCYDWCGVEYVTRSPNTMLLCADNLVVSYHEFPWEVEAFKLQSTFFSKFCEKANRKLLEWLLRESGTSVA